MRRSTKSTSKAAVLLGVLVARPRQCGARPRQCGAARNLDGAARNLDGAARNLDGAARTDGLTADESPRARRRWMRSLCRHWMRSACRRWMRSLRQPSSELEGRRAAAAWTARARRRAGAGEVAYSAGVRSVSEAMRAVLERVPRLGTETVALDDACGRVIAADVIAARALPGFDNSAMDGYAARAAELPGALPVAGVVAAGELRREPVPPGAVVRIFTGAPLPPELDTVVIQEDARSDGDRVVLPASPPGDNVRRAGEDIAVGEAVLAGGTRLLPWHLGVLAALGVARVPVARAPRVALIATGDELVGVETEPGPGQLVDSSMHALGALVREAGGRPERLGIARDEPAAIRTLLEAAAGCDAVITTGGVSVGDRDHVRGALAEAGVSPELWKVAMKPGKPFSFGLRGGTPVFGLPGNPVSTVVAFELFLRPALLAMQGASVLERPRVPVRLPGGYRKAAGRAHYLRARVARESGPTGDGLIAHPHGKQGSAMLSSLVGTNALIELAAELTEVPPGGAATAILLEAV